MQLSDVGREYHLCVKQWGKEEKYYFPAEKLWENKLMMSLNLWTDFLPKRITRKRRAPSGLGFLFPLVAWTLLSLYHLWYSQCFHKAFSSFLTLQALTQLMWPCLNWRIILQHESRNSGDMRGRRAIRGHLVGWPLASGIPLTRALRGHHLWVAPLGLQNKVYIPRLVLKPSDRWPFHPYSLASPNMPCTPVSLHLLLSVLAYAIFSVC